MGPVPVQAVWFSFPPAKRSGREEDWELQEGASGCRAPEEGKTQESVWLADPSEGHMENLAKETFYFSLSGSKIFPYLPEECQQPCSC